MKRITTYLMIMTVVAAVCMPSVALALTNPTVPSGIGGSALTGSGAVRIINDIVNTLITVAVVIGIGYFVFGAIQYFVLENNVKGKATMKNAAIGIGLILAIGLIVQTIAAWINRGLNLG